MEGIIESFLDAGYYRARISSLSEFDKIIGGMAWALQVFSYDINIDVFFADSLDLGQKISLTERLVMVLIAMKCPYRIEPHQIVGLDYANLLPCIRWLLKKSKEIRDEHEAFNRLLALRHYHRVTRILGGQYESRSHWCHVVPLDTLMKPKVLAPGESKQLSSADEINSSRAAKLVIKLGEKFAENRSVSFVKLPSHFRAINSCTTNDSLNSQADSSRYTDLNETSDESESELVQNDIRPAVSDRGGTEMSAEERKLHKDLDDELLATNQKILIQLKKLDCMPNELEIKQYQRRYVELHQQLISKNKDVKKLFDLYNCLDCTKHYLMKEINLLDSIAANLDLTANSNRNKESFLGQFTDIIDRIRTLCEEAQQRRDGLRVRCGELNEEYSNLMD